MPILILSLKIMNHEPRPKPMPASEPESLLDIFATVIASVIGAVFFSVAAAVFYLIYSPFLLWAYLTSPKNHEPTHI